MAILLILLALLGVWGSGTGSSGPKSTKTHSSSSSSSVVTTNQHVTVTTCVVVTWKTGSPSHRHPCSRAPATGTHTLRCSARLKVQLGAGVVENRRNCGGPPANP